jgi:hypothetical protein
MRVSSQVFDCHIFNPKHRLKKDEKKKEHHLGRTRRKKTRFSRSSLPLCSRSRK